MTDTSSLRFVDELPNGGLNGRKREARYDALAENPGRWCEWWGTTTHPNAVHKAAATVHRDGVVFEAAVRQGIAYIRAVKA